ncbi:hypothetical protein N8622_00495 [bacterium]|nr:hypothetical protein [bacterium]
MTIAVFAISLLTLSLSIYLFRLATGESLRRVNMLSYAFMLLFVITYIGCVTITLQIPWLGFEEARMPQNFRHFGQSNSGIFPALGVWVMVMWTFIGIPIGAIFINMCAKGAPISVRMAQYREMRCHAGLQLSEREMFRVVLFATILALLWNLYFSPDNPALRILIEGGGVVEGQIARRQAERGSGFFIMDLLLSLSSLTMLNLMAFAMSINTRLFRWKLLFILGMLSLFLFNISNATISHIMFYMLSLTFTRAMMGGKFIRPIEAVAAMVLVTMFFSFFKGFGEFSLLNVLIDHVSHRIFYGQLFGSYYALEIFPDHKDFLWFSSTGRLIHEFLDAEFNNSYGLIMMRYYYQEGVQAGNAGHYTTFFMGEAWANFSLYGVIIAPLWVGGVVQLVNRFLIKQGRNAVQVAMYVYLSISFGYHSDFIGFYYPVGYIFSVIGFLLLMWISKKLVLMMLPTSRR